MRVVVTSKSPVKVASCARAFSRRSRAVEVIPVKAKSGVNEQPFNDETERGARNRIVNARETLAHTHFYTQVQDALSKATQDQPSGELFESIEEALREARDQVPDADAWVSIENGIFEENGRYIDRAVVAVMNKAGQISISYSDGVEFPAEAVDEARRRGFDQWTVGKVMQERGLVKQHDDPHASLPPYKSRVDYIDEALTKAIDNLDMMGKPKILFGVCGIGSGHTFRQLPLIDHFAQEAEMVIFAYGHSLDFYSDRFRNTPHVTVAPVAVPFYAHDRHGIDFNATAREDRNKGQDFHAINAAAMQLAEEKIGKPDLVVSDYEPTSAQYAYAKGARLVTIDQQSKYLAGDFPGLLNGEGYQNEVQMLRMFFPKAEARLACSFFRAAKRPEAVEEVEICPPVLNESILNVKRAPSSDKTSILVYISSQQPFSQSPAEVAAVCATRPDVEFHVFGRDTAGYAAPNVKTYEHGDPHFHEVLGTCNGIVSTAGHTLLSEAMHLGIPVYAIPLPLYEQQMNARVVHENKFGVSHPSFDAGVLDTFISHLPEHAAAIGQDKDVLLREPGQALLIRHVERRLRC